MGHFEKIFDEPEPNEGPDEFANSEYTQYPATARRTDRHWSVTVHDLPEGRAVLAQGANWAEAHRNAHAAVVELLGVEPHTIGITMRPDDPEVVAALDAVTNARVARADAEQAERDIATRTARLLTGKGWTVRDAGGVLSLSPQRISQLSRIDIE